MKVFIEKEEKVVESKAKTGLELLKSLDINPTTVLLIQKNEVILPEETLSEDDIKIFQLYRADEV